jgi:4-hydroxy-3-methylbut-2-enyl diphosphate reductase
VDDADAIDPRWLQDVRRVGVTAGASAPEYLVQGVVRRLRELGATATVEVGNPRENVTFRLPASVLRRRAPRTIDTVVSPAAFAGTL